ncbi:MAG: helix-turn-helix domain-containing protein [Oscillospiraceae bacterium]|nr:helix-turn-helix domain-containing protein [Oscillospiraceae bacterium]
MDLPKTLARLRTQKKITQATVAAYVSEQTNKPISFRAISYWETGISSPSVEQFLVLCDLYDVEDIHFVFRGVSNRYENLTRLNELGRNRVEEYIELLLSNNLFADRDARSERTVSRYIKLFDVSVAAVSGNLLDNDSYEELAVDDMVPDEADYAVRVTGNSMIPRFIDGQIVFVKAQPWIDIGEIGIFSLNGDAYIKKLGVRELVSLNPDYDPISIGSYDSVYVLGRVLG